MNLSVSASDLALIKLEIIANAVENDKIKELDEKMFFKTFSQLEASKKLSTGDRIWIGRMLRLSNNDKPVKNINGIAIFQEKHQYKKVRRIL